MIPDDRWILEAACRGMDIKVFFPEKGASTEPAKRVCARCPVADECLASAVVQGDRHGVWGEKSERQRRSIRRGSVTGKGFVRVAVCNQCGGSFESIRANPGSPVKYCSDVCSRAAHNARQAAYRTRRLEAS